MLGALSASAGVTSKPQKTPITDLTACHPSGQSRQVKRWLTGHGAYDIFISKNNNPVFCIDQQAYDPLAKLSIQIDVKRDGVTQKEFSQVIYNPKKDGPAVMIDTGGACEIYAVIGRYAILDGGVESTPTETDYLSLNMCR
jgi:hypothetical protein